VKLYVYYELSDLKSTAEIASSVKLYAALTAADPVRVHTVLFFFLTHQSSLCCDCLSLFSASFDVLFVN
jgi:hypothetical protein